MFTLNKGFYFITSLGFVCLKEKQLFECKLFEANIQPPEIIENKCVRKDETISVVDFCLTTE